MYSIQHYTFIAKDNFFWCASRLRTWPTLLLYVNYMSKVSNILHFILFADDISRRPQCRKDTAKAELNKPSLWFLENRLTVNVSKCNFIVLHSQRAKYNSAMPNLILNFNTLQQVKFTKFLRFYIDEHLS